MKLLLVFALFGITCCFAIPFCSKEELEKCSQGPSHGGSEEDELNTYCRQVKCWLKVYDRCGLDIFGLKGHFPIKGFHKVVDTFCHRGPMRSKYLENVKCIKDSTKDFRGLLKKCDIKDRPREEFCRQIPYGMRCATSYVTEKCGRDAGEVFMIAALPGFDPYDCLSQSL